MKDILEKQLENNYSIIIYILALKDKRYDLFFKMMGGQNGGTYRALKEIKNTLITVKDANSFGGLLSVLNPDGAISKNHYLVAIALLTGIRLEFIQKKIAAFNLWVTDKNWLNNTFTPEEVKTILQETETWKTKIK